MSRFIGIAFWARIFLLVVLILVNAMPASDRGWVELDARLLKEFIRNASANEVLIINIWATWCEPCRKEFPYYAEARKKYRNQGIRIEFISADFSDQRQQVEEFLRSFGVDGPIYIKTGKDQEFIEALHSEWSGAIPATFIFRNGKLLDFWEGMISEDLWIKKINQYKGGK